MLEATRKRAQDNIIEINSKVDQQKTISFAGIKNNSGYCPVNYEAWIALAVTNIRVKQT